jgi:D-cysteine desulfhydrase
MKNKVKNTMLSCIQEFRFPISLMPSEINVIDGYVGPGYAQADQNIYDFIAKMGTNEGIFFDPVYTGKAAFGLISECSKSKEGAERFGKNVLLIHTGGFPSIFAHKEKILSALKNQSSPIEDFDL